MPASTVYSASNASELQSFLGLVQALEGLTGEAGAYTIELTANITPAADLPAIVVDAGSSLTIIGNGDTLSGGSAHQGLFAYSGNLTVENLTIAAAHAVGGAGGSGGGGGGGGAGLGGGLFVGSAANVTLQNVAFQNDAATGGQGGSTLFSTSAGGGGGGGGLGGHGGNGAGGETGGGGGGGGVGNGASGGGGTTGSTGGGGAGGIIAGASSGGQGDGDNNSSGGVDGGGGGGGTSILSTTGYGAAGGGVGGANGNYDSGANGGFGGGGGGGGGNTHDDTGGAGGFGGGGGSGETGGNGGFGGGGGAGDGGVQGSGGFGAGNGKLGGGGGGLGAGGDIFVQQGGALTIEGGSLGAGTVKGGAGGGGNGQGLGSGIFIQGNQSVTLSTVSGQTLTVSGAITDQGGNGGTGTLVVAGPGMIDLQASNNFGGGIQIQQEVTLELGASSAAGAGTISFAATSGAALVIDQAAFTTATASFDGVSGTAQQIGNAIDGLAQNTLDLAGVGFVPGQATTAVVGDLLQLADYGTTYLFQLNNVPDNTAVALSSDGNGGTDIVLDPHLVSVGSDAQLQAAISQFESLGQSGTIDFVGNITETADLSLIDPAGGTSLTINGNGYTLDGAGTYQGFFVYAGAVSIENLTLANLHAVGGAGGAANPWRTANGGGGGGGGGAGLGGGLFIGHNATVSLSDVNFTADAAIGGTGGTLPSNPTATNGEGGGGGGGLGGAGGLGTGLTAHGNPTGDSGGGGGGGLGLAALGGNGGTSASKDGGATGAGANLGAAGNGGTTESGSIFVSNPLGGSGGGSGGGGGGGATPPSGGISQTGGGGGGGGGGIGGQDGGSVGHFSNGGAGGAGGYGGGGGGGGGDLVGDTAFPDSTGGAGGGGGFGGGGGGGAIGATHDTGGAGGAGGFGGGGGGGAVANGFGSTYGQGGAGGFGAGAGGNGKTTYNNNSAGAGGGGGLGAGGDIFLSEGGVLTIAGGNLSGGGATGGQGGLNAGSGAAYGSGLFIQGNQTVTLAPGAGQTMTLADSIADMTGSHDASGQTGAGTLVIGSGDVILGGANTYVGGTTIDAGATLDLGTAGGAGAGTISFAGAASLVLGAQIANVIAGFLPGDDIVDTGVATIALSTLGGNPYGRNVTLYDGLSNELGTINLSTVSTSHGIVLNAGTISYACYAEGTAIATPDGETAIEALREGDQVLTAEGEARPVIWLGHRLVDCTAHPTPADVWPVRIRADAFAAGAPHRDLLVSPEHAILVDGFLMPARALLNGATIVQEARDRITWWHLELATHDAILAEGLAAETYLDTGNRNAFENAGPSLQLHPRFGRNAHNALACAPFADTGRAVDVARAHLLARAAELGFAAGPGAWWVEADGVALEAAQDGSFLMPAGATDVLIRAEAWRPMDLEPGNADTRWLGLCVGTLAIDGTKLALDDALLGAGFHPVERKAGMMWRWTKGAAVLPARLLAGDRPTRLEIGIAALPRAWRQVA